MEIQFILIVLIFGVNNSNMSNLIDVVSDYREKSIGNIQVWYIGFKVMKGSVYFVENVLLNLIFFEDKCLVGVLLGFWVRI